MSWDDPYLEPDRDPLVGRMVPCVVCMASPQVGGTGVCSPECEEALEEWNKEGEEALEEWYKEGEDDRNL